MVLRLPRLQTNTAIVDIKTGNPTTAFTRFWNEAMGLIETNVNGIQAALDAAAAANAAAVVAQTAAATATTAAAAAQASADGNGGLNNVLNSGVDEFASITSQDVGTDIDIIVSANTRYRPDGTSTACSGTTITHLAYSTRYWIYYDDPTDADTTPTYIATDDGSEPQATTTNPHRYYMGTVLTGAALDPDQAGTMNFWAG